MLCCIYSGGRDGFNLLLLLEVVCVTGLPARTARPFVPSFFVFERYTCHGRRSDEGSAPFPIRTIPDKMQPERVYEALVQESLCSRLGRVCAHGCQLRSVVESRRGRSGLPPFSPLKSEFPSANSFGIEINWRELPIFLAEARLSAGHTSQQRGLSTSLQLPV